ATSRGWLTDDLLVGDRADDGLELGHREELQVGLGVAGVLTARAAGTTDGVVRAPVFFNRVLEDAMREREHVPHRLGALACLEHLLAQGFDSLAIDAPHR